MPSPADLLLKTQTVGAIGRYKNMWFCPRSTARAWLGTAPTVVVGLEVAALTELELRQEVLKLRRRVQKLVALLRLALVLLRVSGFTLSGERLPTGRDKLRILGAIDQARACIPLRALLRLLRLSPSRFHAWRRRHTPCALDDQSSCPRTSPHRLTQSEIRAIKDLVTSPKYRHVPTGTLAVLAVLTRPCLYSRVEVWRRVPPAYLGLPPGVDSVAEP